MHGAVQILKGFEQGCLLVAVRLVNREGRTADDLLDCVGIWRLYVLQVNVQQATPLRVQMGKLDEAFFVAKLVQNLSAYLLVDPGELADGFLCNFWEVSGFLCFILVAEKPFGFVLGLYH